MDRVICTAGGRAFDPIDPDPAVIDLRDIAHALSFVPRFGGHSRLFYSVAQHSVLVRDLVAEQCAEDRILGAALLHDAAEAYLLDMPSPIKRSLPDYTAAEKRLQRIIETRYGVAQLSDAERALIKEADQIALIWEQRDIMPAVAWAELPSLDRPALDVWSPDVARQAFLTAADTHLNLEKAIA
ncbi:MAG: hypothetical protein R3200_05985 [Xanthomonadales bacterium]|nr:hypothetical protein [Xanthomonadales bacterium]